MASTSSCWAFSSASLVQSFLILKCSKFMQPLQAETPIGVLAYHTPGPGFYPQHHTKTTKVYYWVTALCRPLSPCLPTPFLLPGKDDTPPSLRKAAWRWVQFYCLANLDGVGLHWFIFKANSALKRTLFFHTMDTKEVTQQSLRDNLKCFARSLIKSDFILTIFTF